MDNINKNKRNSPSVDLANGVLHNALNLPKGVKIPHLMLSAHLTNSDPHIRKMAQLALKQTPKAL